MKNLFFKTSVTFIFFLCAFSSLHVFAQDEGLGLPGDNLNLSAVLDVFQKSKTLEEFETSINSDNYKINNLDLNYDGRVDYIKVIDYPDGDTHSIMLETDINKNETQSIAVIYVDKKRNGDVDIQIVGDEALYGKDYVIDLGSNNSPNGTPNPGYNGGVVYDDYDDGYYASPSGWNIVVYMYAPYYSRWYSPWYWGYYPRWWSPWNAFYWNDYYYHCYHNYPWQWRYYYYGSRNRFHRHHSNWYKNHRHHSVVYNNYRQKGVYNKSYQGRPPIRKPLAGKVVNQAAIRNDKLTSPGKRENINQIERRENNKINNTPAVQPARQERTTQPETPRPVERAIQPDTRPQQEIKQPRPVERTNRPESRPVEPVARPEQRPPVMRQEPRPVPQRPESKPNNPQGEKRPRR